MATALRLQHGTPLESLSSQNTILVTHLIFTNSMFVLQAIDFIEFLAAIHLNTLQKILHRSSVNSYSSTSTGGSAWIRRGRPRDGTERVDRLHANDGEYLPGGRASIVLSQCSVIGNLLRRVGWLYRLRSGDARPLPALPT